MTTRAVGSLWGEEYMMPTSRTQLIRLAASHPKGSADRRAVLAQLKTGATFRSQTQISAATKAIAELVDNLHNYLHWEGKIPGGSSKTAPMSTMKFLPVIQKQFLHALHANLGQGVSFKLALEAAVDQTLMEDFSTLG